MIFPAPSRLRLAFLMAATAVLAAPGLAQNYTITDLGVVSNAGTTSTGDTDSAANAINADGTVVGFSGVYDTSYRNLGFLNLDAFVWKPSSKNGTTGTISYLGGLPGDICVDTFHGGGLVGPLDTDPLGINSAGQAVGYSFTSSGPCVSLLLHGALWQNGTVTDFGYSPPGLLGTFSSYATSINDSGQIVGYTVPQQAFYPSADVWLYDGTFHDLGTLPGLPFALANKINNGGTIVGVSTTGTATQIGSISPELVPAGTVQAGGAPRHGPNAEGNKVPGVGAMAGSPRLMNPLAGRGFPSAALRSPRPLDSSSTGLASYSGFAHTGPGTIQPSDQIGTLGGPNSSANGINEAGVIAGGSSIANGAVHGFELNQGAMFDLGTLSTDPLSNSSANAINRANDIVGWSDVDPAHSWMSPQHAVLWESGGNMIDLNSLLLQNSVPPVAPPVGTTKTVTDCPTCWELIAATDINDLGQIVGIGLLNGHRHAFLLTPACAAAGGDTDGDGLCDDWEKNGYTAPDGTLVNLPQMGADPNHKDIFVQADYMVNWGGPCSGSACFGHTHQLTSDALASLIAVFASAPVQNPDGFTGIRLHVDCGPDCPMNPLTGATWGGLSQAQEIAEIPVLGSKAGACTTPLDVDGYCWDAFNAIKATNFAQSRHPIFHYMIAAHQLGYNGAGNPFVTSGTSGSVPNSDFITALGGMSLPGDVGTRLQQAGVFMHELGHNLGLRHGGQDGVNNKPNYLSVMNYLFQGDGLFKDNYEGLLDYSRFFSIPPMNEAGALDENVGLHGGALLDTYGTSYYCPGGNASTGVGRKDISYANIAIDWNCDNTIESTATADVNAAYDSGGNPIYATLYGSEDWSHLIYNGGAIGAAGAALLPATYPNSDPESSLPIDSQAPFRLAVVSPGVTRVVPGTSLSLTFTINNTGLQQDTYNLSAVSTLDWWTTTGVPSSVTLAGGASQQITVSVTVPGCVTPGTQGKFTIEAMSPLHPRIVEGGVAALSVLPNPPGSVSVPNVVGLTQTAAQTALVSAGLVAGTVTMQSSTTVTAGTVISQSLTACAVVGYGSSVALTVSSGPPVVGVPNVVGDTQDAATAAIIGAGLTVGTIYTAMSATVPAYDVMLQYPLAGASVAPGSAVNFTISSGSVVFHQVPDVTGLSQGLATSALAASGLTLGTGTPVLSPTGYMFSIVSQNPAAGSFIAAGAAVNVQFSAGTHLYPVPNLVGEPEVRALYDIAATQGGLGNFEVSVSRHSSTTVPDGYVISQTPAGGSSAMATSPINLVVSSGGPVMAAVPNLIGTIGGFANVSSTNGFAGNIYPAGFALGSVTPQFSLQPVNTVLSQNPAPGTIAPWDTPINVVLSAGEPSLQVVTVPNVVGMTQGAAIIALDEVAGYLGGPLTWAVTTQSSATVPAGNVISQNPPPGPTRIPVPLASLTPSAALLYPMVNLVVSTGTTVGPSYSFLTQFGNYGSQQGEFGTPFGLAIDPVSRNIVVGDGYGRVQTFDANGRFLSYFGGWVSGAFTGAWTDRFPGDGTGDGLFSSQVYGIAIDPVNHNIVATDEAASRVMIFNSAGQLQSMFGSPGSGPGQFFSPFGVAIDPTSEHIIVTDKSNNSRVQIFDSNGNYLSQFGTLGIGNGQFGWPAAVAIDPVNHNIVVTDTVLERVQIFDSNGNYLRQFGTPGLGTSQFSTPPNGLGAGQFLNPNAVAIDPASHNIFVGDSTQQTVQIFDSNGNFLSSFGGPGQLNVFGGMAIDPVTHDILFTGGTIPLLESVLIFAPASIPTATAVAASVNPSVVAQPVTLTATVTGNNPTGTVQFMDGAATLGAPGALTAGVATLTLSTLAVGTHPITAVYSGDASNSASTSAVLSELVNPDTTPPVVTPPAGISIPATQPAGATGNAWPALAAFLAGGSAVDPDSPSLTRLPPQVGGVTVDNTTLFPLGTTTVTFRFQDPSGNIASATSTVMVAIGTPRITGSSAGAGTDPSGAIYVNIVLSNTGTGNARNLVLNSLAFRTLSGTGTVTYNSTLSPSLPLAIGNLDVGTGVTTRVYLNVPSTATRISITESEQVQDVLGNKYNYSTAEAVIP